jgi:hypothetical protein
MRENVWSEALKKRLVGIPRPISEEDNIKINFGEIMYEDEEWVQVMWNMT